MYPPLPRRRPLPPSPRRPAVPIRGPPRPALGPRRRSREGSRRISPDPPFATLLPLSSAMTPSPSEILRTRVRRAPGRPANGGVPRNPRGHLSPLGRKGPRGTRGSAGQGWPHRQRGPPCRRGHPRPARPRCPMRSLGTRVLARGEARGGGSEEAAGEVPGAPPSGPGSPPAAAPGLGRVEAPRRSCDVLRGS